MNTKGANITMQKVRKAVIPAAGFGTRFLPATKAEYCEQIEPPVRMIEPASAINRATQCERESH